MNIIKYNTNLKRIYFEKIQLINNDIKPIKQGSGEKMLSHY